MSLLEEVQQKISEREDFADFYVVDIFEKRADGDIIVEIFLDKDDGYITIDNCRKICKHLVRAYEPIEEEKGISIRFEVSSPGLDRPLKLVRQYTKNIGKGIKVITNEGETVLGTLKEIIGEEKIIIEVIKGNKKKKEISAVEVLISSINKATIEVFL